MDWAPVWTLGVNSTLGNDQHILMFEWDHWIPHIHIRALVKMQRLFSLPRVVLIASSPGHMHAYCFRRSTIQEATELARAVGCDPAWVDACTSRGYFTLRIEGQFVCEAILPSGIDDDANPLEITSFSEYLRAYKDHLDGRV